MAATGETSAGKIHPEGATRVDAHDPSHLSLLDSVLASTGRAVHWSKMPVLLGTLYMAAKRHRLQQRNLLAVGGPPGEAFDCKEYPFRTDDGAFNTPEHSRAGATGSFFGRNMPVDPSAPAYNADGLSAVGTYPPVALDTPPVQLVAQKLLTRNGPIKSAGPQFNVLAAAWIQLMIHDWIDHDENTAEPPVVLDKGKESGCPLHQFRFNKTLVKPAGAGEVTSGTTSLRSAWWDGSVVYGQTPERARQVRSGVGGKLKVAEGGDLVLDAQTGLPTIGDVRNSWAGLTVLQTLFVNEHNLVCDAVAAAHPDFDDEKLYHTARLVVAALMAKVHTIDWTVELLKTPGLHLGMRANWYGLLGKSIKESFGHTNNSILSGLVGLKTPVLHGTPYSLTEEFTSVYRMHSLLPDALELRDVSKPDAPVVDKVSLTDMCSPAGEAALLSRAGVRGVLVSMGVQACGLLRLNNYPNPLRNVMPENVDGTQRADAPVDLAALDLFRDRERGVPRYNHFRRMLQLPPVSSWAALTPDPDEQRALADVYGPEGVEQMDLLVGMHAEQLIPGFAISETAFMIFVVMASRRLEADRFFTTDYTEETYTKEGLAWIQKTEGLKDIIARYDAGLAQTFIKTRSAFSQWGSRDPPHDTLPPLLQIPGWDWPWARKPAALLRQIPGPRQLPVLGNALPLLQHPMHRQLLAWADQYGGVYYAKLGPGKDTVVVSDPVLVEQLCAPLPEGLPKNHPMYETVQELVSPEKVDNLITATHYQYHKSVREQLALAFAPEAVAAVFPSVKVTVVGDLVNKVAEAAAKGTGGVPGAVLDVFDVLLRATVKIAGRVNWGLETDTLGPADDVTAADATIEALKAVRPEAFARLKNPLLKMLPQPQYDKHLAEIHGLFKRGHEQVKTLQCPVSNGSPPTEIPAALRCLKDWYSGEPIDDKLQLANAGVLGLAGIFPVATAAAYALFEITAQPRVLKALEAELAAAGLLGTPETLTYEALQHLPLLQGAVKEAMRVHTIAPLGNRVTEREMELSGFVIPKGTPVTPFIGGIHGSVHNFIDPAQFIPERWQLPLEDVRTQHAGPGSTYKGPAGLRFEKDAQHPDATPVGNIHNLEGSFVPFSAGERGCLGKHIGWMEILTLVAGMLAAFHVTLGSDKNTEQAIAEEDFAVTAYPTKPLELRFVKRAPPS